MDSKEMGKLIRGAVDIVNRLSDEVETMFGDFCRLSALVEPLAWVPSGRTYGRYFTAGRATQPRPLPQTLYRVFLPSAGAPTSEMYGPEQDDEKVHLRLKPDTRVLVMAVQLYEAHQSGDVEPDLLAAELSDFVFEGSSAGLTGLRRKHLRQMIEAEDFPPALGSARIGPMGMGLQRRVGCLIRVLARSPLTALPNGGAIEDFWRKVGKLAAWSSRAGRSK
jgi:hypothetical protein